MSLFPSVLSLSDLDGNNGLTINGVDAGDLSGSSVSSAGDVNGDGIDDFIIGAATADSGDALEVGRSYIVFGSSRGFETHLKLSDLDGRNGFVLTGRNPFDGSGWSVSSAGDINGDGIDNIVVGAPGADPNGSL